MLDLDHDPTRGRTGGRAGRGGARRLVLRHLRRHTLVEKDGALEAGFSDARAVELDGADRVVVARDHEVDVVGIAVGIDDCDDGDPEALCLGHRDRLAIHVDHEEHVGQARHLLEAVEGLAVLLDPATDAGQLLLRDLRHLLLVRDQLEQLLETLDRLLDGLEVGEHPAQPAVVDVELTGTLRFETDRRLGLPFGADGEHPAPIGDRLPNEIQCRLEARQRLVEIDNVDAVALTEQEALHARIPAPRLVPEVDTGFQQVADRQLFALEGGRRSGHGGAGPGRLRGLSRRLGHRISPSRFCVRPGPSFPNRGRPRRSRIERRSGTAGVTRNV